MLHKCIAHCNAATVCIFNLYFVFKRLIWFDGFVRYCNRLFYLTQCVDEPYTRKTGFDGIINFFTWLRNHFFYIHNNRFVFSSCFIIRQLNIFYCPHFFSIFVFCDGGNFIPACNPFTIYHRPFPVSAIRFLQHFFRRQIIFYFVLILVNIIRKIAIVFIPAH